jgi:hypothetical protein
MRKFTANFNRRYATNISASSMQRYTKSMRAVLCNSFVKPLLKDYHKMNRLQIVLNRLEPTREGNYRIKDMKNVVHVDEKWFYVTREKRKVRQFPEEQLHPDQTVIHKSHIEKVMFLAAVGVPQFRPDGTWFNEKIGIWPVIECTPAQRSSALRSAGAEVMKPVPLSAKTYLDLMTREGGVIQAIRKKMSWLCTSGVVIQHDGASPHVGKDNDFYLACSGWEHDLNLSFIRQPAQSPDLNKLDLLVKTVEKIQ